jgi:hypothetical protein
MKKGFSIPPDLYDAWFSSPRGIVTARVISKGRYGKTRVIALTVSPETVKKVLSVEEGLRDVLI